MLLPVMHPGLHEFEKLYARVLSELDKEDEKNLYLLKLFNDLIISMSEAFALHFNTLFARVSYITTRYQLNKGWAYALQIVRREMRERKMEDHELFPILKSSIDYLLSIYRSEVSEEGYSPGAIPVLPKLPVATRPGRFKKKYARVVATAWDTNNKVLTIADEEWPDMNCFLHYAVEGKNDIYADTLELVLAEFGLPLILGLTDIDCTEENYYIPGFIVIMPDLLMDVTSVATTLSNGSDPLAVNIINQFLPSESSEAIMAGQVANFFLDELIRDTNATYADLFARTFKLYPIEFVQLSNEQLRSMYKKMQTHFDNIKKVIDQKFSLEGIDKNECVIEPSYFSPQYGVKGRLDLYYQHPENKGASIIELKSGKPFRSNSYGLNKEHYHQTLLYELMIKSVHGPAHHRMNYILYSCIDEQPLRYAVSVESIQKEIIQNRNQLVLLQLRMLLLDKDGGRDIMSEIYPGKYEEFKGYIQTNIQKWHTVYASLSPGEKSYFKSFSAFITREHMLARIGNEGAEGAGGLAGLWIDTIQTKEERYQILRALDLRHIEKSSQHTQLTFTRSRLTNPLANFRAGDIAIMYPYHDDDRSDPTKYQLHRAIISEVNATEVSIRLRNNQVHTSQIEGTLKWNVEHDLLDSSFRALYQSLWCFISASPMQRQLIFGLRMPPIAEIINNRVAPEGLTEKQTNLYHEALNAGPLYLLWGPPGTGKTSRMLKSWVWHYYFETDSRIAILAYTNKAVDEICQAIEELGKEVCEHYIRIGSRAGCGEAYKKRLLDNIIEPMNRRSEIKELLEHTRIFVATVASMHGKSELYKLVQFDVAIIDEASQILEPAMVGLLTKFRKTILIGDHMQLPAVCTQPVYHSQIKQYKIWAERIGLTDMCTSYFERIYRLYSAKKWDHVIGILSEQGRMHHDIQEFANKIVYNHQLTCLNPMQQSQLLSELTGDHQSTLFSKRLIYIPVAVSLPDSYHKTNDEEAEKTIWVLRSWQLKMKAENLNWSIGIITPFRAQIAAILHKAHLLNMDMKNVSVDTVERYQGGARDIIIMSCAVNSRHNLTRITSLNEEGIDRKLNVAVTRARQQFVLIGSEHILSQEKAYSALISMSTRISQVAIMDAVV